jgi:hypothetical protein
VYSLRLAGEIWIEGTNNDAGMVGAAAMQPDEMSAIQGQNCPAAGYRVIKHLLVGHRLPGLAGFLGCQNIVAEAAQFIHDP